MSLGADHLDVWVKEGFLSAEQASAIRAYERQPPAGRPTAVLEGLGYVGAVFVLVAGMLLLVDLWPDLSRAARVGLVGSAAIVLTGAGLVVAHTEHPRIRRVGSTLLLLALVPTGVAVGLIAEASVDDEAAILAGFAAATVLAFVLYVRDRNSVAQHAGLFLSSMGTTLFALVSIDDVSDWLPGLMLVVAGVAWMVLASFEIVMPRSFGEAVGAIAVLFGSVAVAGSLTFEDGGYGLVVLAFSVVIALGAIGFGVAKDRIVVVVAGMAGLIIFLPWLVNDGLGENIGAPIALLVAGTLLIGSAVYLTKRRR